MEGVYPVYIKYCSYIRTCVALMDTNFSDGVFESLHFLITVIGGGSSVPEHDAA